MSDSPSAPPKRVGIAADHGGFQSKEYLDGVLREAHYEVALTAQRSSFTAKLGRKLYEVPVGLKWFVDGLLDGSLGFAGEESAGASFVRLDGSVWTTDKDGIVPVLLAAEITAPVGD